jgi:hypothetical protein
MRLKVAVPVIVACAALYAIGCNDTAPTSTPASPLDAKTIVKTKGPEPVAVNRSDTPDGFRGEVHSLLTGQTRLPVTAYWTPVSHGRDELYKSLHPTVYAWFAELKPVQPQATYTERDFSAFLPASVAEVGQTWSIDAEKMLVFLKQFHPRASVHLVAAGRRAGPDGAFGVLRAVSDDYLDIAFRVHGEYYLTPDDKPLVKTWYTPAYFSGHLLVNRKKGTVEFFRFGIPTDKALNVHLTASHETATTYQDARDVVRVDRMELVGGDAAAAEKVAWSKSLPQKETDEKLAKVFYKFLEIAWVPFEKAAEKAKTESKPIFAVVSWGSFEDQSC